MAGSLNKVMLIGRLGQEPELKYTQSGQAVTNFSLATDEGYTRDGQKVEKTEWHKIVVWGKQAEMCSNYLSKGRLIMAEGKLQTRQWEDQNGQKRYTTEIVAFNIQFLDSKKDTENNTGYVQAPPHPATSGQNPMPDGDQDAGNDMGSPFPSEASKMDETPF